MSNPRSEPEGLYDAGRATGRERTHVQARWAVSAVTTTGWDERLSRRRYATGSLGGSVLATVAFCWMVTGGTWDFLQSGLYTDFYDAQARALLAGHWNMPASVLLIEGIVEHGRTYMYYGPVPAILRMPVLLVTHRLDGRLTQPSMLLAYLVALFFTARLGWKIRRLVAGDRDVSGAEALLVGVVMLVIGVGSSLFFLASDPIIYHEAELWGAALAIAAFDFLLSFLLRHSLLSAVLAGVFATLSILTRASVGAGPVAALALTAAVWCVALRRRGGGHGAPWRRRLAAIFGVGEPEARLAQALVLIACVLVPVVSYAAINEVKFGTLFSLPLEHQVETVISAHRKATLAANGGSLFGLKFVPTALLAYLRPDALQVTRLFPFLMFPPSASVIGHVLYDDRDWASSIPATMPLLGLWAVVGLWSSFRPRRRRFGGGVEPLGGVGSEQEAAGALGAADVPAEEAELGLRVLRIPMVGAAVGTIGVLTIAFIANRYLADFMPLVVLAGLSGFQVTVHWVRGVGAASPAGDSGHRRGRHRAGRHPAGSGRSGRHRSLRRPLSVTAMSLLGAFGLWSNAALGIVYQFELRAAVPLSMRADFVSFQERLDAKLFGNPPANVLRTSRLGGNEPAGTLEIVGRCTALYESTGLSGGWDAVERSEAGGHFRLQVVFPATTGGAWMPVLANGQAQQGDFLALRSVSRGSYQFGYLFQAPGQDFITGTVFSAVPGRSYVVDAVLDPRIGEIAAEVDGNSEYDLGYLVRNAQPYDVGINDFGGPVAARFPGSVHQLAVTTPICQALERRFGPSP